ncbi:MAG TPA: MCE family protein [Mycobacteriales bacterium]|jgi:phospholipid/cholesterol/gamma-HCH transport system substrate-binding protein|nr:MCE family protein [Mycobacteriales bacterium]
MSRLRGLVAAAASAAVLSGCGFHGVYSLPLPGAAAKGGHTYTVKVQLADVLDLVPYSAVKVNAATVGHVKSIAVEGRHAVVTCQLPDSVKLPANAIARVEQTSVLGEKFVEIEPPANARPMGRLSDGDVIALPQTDTDATVEEVLGALSMLLNGGGVDQLHTITHELSVALNGRADAARALLGHLREFVGGLDGQKQQIISAMEGLDRLTSIVRGQERTLTTAIDTMPSAVKILADDRQRLTHMLVSVDHLGRVATHVLNASHADLVANLRNLQPTLDRLARVGDVIPITLQAILTYPTADTVEQEYFGDYGNLALTIDASASSLLNTFGPQLSSLFPNAFPKSRRRSGSASPTSPTSPSSPLPLPLPGPTWLQGNDIGALLLGGLR